MGRNLKCVILMFVICAVMLTGCGMTDPGKAASDKGDNSINESSNDRLTTGTENHKGFQMDNVLHSDSLGEIHYHIYVPDSYDGSELYALYVTLPGYEGLYFQGVGANLKSENFAFEAQIMTR